MIIRDERILCMCAISGNLILAGTKRGHILVFDSNDHSQLHVMSELADSVLSLRRFLDGSERFVIAGLANGHLAMYREKQFKIAGSFT